MTDPGYENLLQMYGPLYPHSDYKRGAHIRYYADNGEIRSGEIVWVQEPGTALGGYHLWAQYIVDSGRDMPDVVSLGNVLSD